MEEQDRKPPEKEMDEKKTEDKLPFCTTAPSPEHARAQDEDEPCDDGRAGQS